MPPFQLISFSFKCSYAVPFHWPKVLNFVFDMADLHLY